MYTLRWTLRSIFFLSIRLCSEPRRGHLNAKDGTATAGLVNLDQIRRLQIPSAMVTTRTAILPYSVLLGKGREVTQGRWVTFSLLEVSMRRQATWSPLFS